MLLGFNLTIVKLPIYQYSCKYISTYLQKYANLLFTNFITSKVLGNCDYKAEVKKWKINKIHLEYFKMVNLLWYPLYKHVIKWTQFWPIKTFQSFTLNKDKKIQLDITLHVKNSIIWSCKWNGFKMITWNNFFYT
jgi:hypothetical protein